MRSTIYLYTRREVQEESDGDYCIWRKLIVGDGEQGKDEIARRGRTWPNKRPWAIKLYHPGDNV